MISFSIYYLCDNVACVLAYQIYVIFANVIGFCYYYLMFYYRSDEILRNPKKTYKFSTFQHDSKFIVYGYIALT